MVLREKIKQSNSNRLFILRGFCRKITSNSVEFISVLPGSVRIHLGVPLLLQNGLGPARVGLTRPVLVLGCGAHVVD